MPQHNENPSQHELSDYHTARLFTSALPEWNQEPCVINYGAILVCRQGSAMLRINFNEYKLHPGAVTAVFPGDLLHLKDCCDFQAEVLRYNASLLREASLQLEQTVYSSLREDRCQQDNQIVRDIINNMFSLLRIYFEQNDCACVSQLVLLQLKAFFIGFHDYLQRNPHYRPDEVKSRRVRYLFNWFMMLIERDYKFSRDVSYYARLMNITPKYLTNIVLQVTSHTPKVIIDQYTTLQLKSALRLSGKSIKEIAWEYHFSDVSFFSRYFKRQTGISPQAFRS